MPAGSWKPAPSSTSQAFEGGDYCSWEAGKGHVLDQWTGRVCTFARVSSSAESDKYKIEVCNVATGVCEPDPIANSMSREDGDSCTWATGTA